MRVAMSIAILALSAALAVEASAPASREILENDKVLVEEVVFAPGDDEPEHTHAFDLVLVFIAGGFLESTTPDGKVTRLGGRPGEVVFLPKGSTHRAKNTSGKAVSLRLIVLK